MRARLGLATTLWEFARRDEAVGHLQDMLRLNPNDNQGVRYILAGFLLFLDRDDELGRLLDRYHEEGSAVLGVHQGAARLPPRGRHDRLAPAPEGGPQGQPLRPRLPPGRRELPAVTSPTITRPATRARRWSTSAVPHRLEVHGGRDRLAPGQRPHQKKAEGPQGKGPLGFVKKWLTTHLSREGRRVAGRLPPDAQLAAARRRLHPAVGRPRDQPRRGGDPGPRVADGHARRRPSCGTRWSRRCSTPRRARRTGPPNSRFRPGEAWESLRPHFEEVGVRLDDGGGPGRTRRGLRGRSTSRSAASPSRGCSTSRA